VRVVLGTNVLLAAFATRGLCEALLAACLQSHKIVLSEHILTELARHLTGKLRMPLRQAREIDMLLRENADLVEPALLPAGVCSDPDDVPVLGAAVAAKADALVTGDADLLTLGEVGGVPILSPRAFYDRLL
jgi:putative PIN family toxin of toxin-antitoxin system